MNWKQYLNELADDETGFIFAPPITLELIIQLKAAFQSDVPPELVECYLQSNGIKQTLKHTSHNNEIIIGDLIWSSEKLIQENILLRTYSSFKELYMSFDNLLFFSDAGNGDMFGFLILNGKYSRKDIFVWNHEDDSRTWVANSMQEFVAGWLNGKITI